MSVILAIVLLVVGFVLGRLYQWIKGELAVSSMAHLDDPIVTARRTNSDIAATARRAEEQIRRLGQRSGARPRP